MTNSVLDGERQQRPASRRGEWRETCLFELRHQLIPEFKNYEENDSNDKIIR